MRARIIGTGSYLPGHVMTNEDLSRLVDTSDEWIRSRTGICSRHLAGEEETTASMAYEASLRALEDAGVEPGELDLIAVATCTADTLTPSTACMLQGMLGASAAAAFDLNAACSGYVYALGMVDAAFQCGLFRKALVVGAETLSRIIDWKDRSVCVLFGDGAGAAVVSAQETGMIAVELGSDGSRAGKLIVHGRGNQNPFVPAREGMDMLHMDGNAVYEFACRSVPQSIDSVLDKAGLSPAQVDLFLLHQANYRILKNIAAKLRLPMERFPHNMDHVGNTSAASIPILLDETRRQGLIREGDMVVLSGFGAGLTWASALMKM